MIYKKIINAFKYNNPFKKKDLNYFFGCFSSWEEALSSSKGYQSPVILEKVVSSIHSVLDGKAIFERDGVLFHSPQYHWPLIASLLHISVQKSGQLNIVDFGGGLGSTYFQNRSFFNKNVKSTWSIVEQKHYVDAGKKIHPDGNIKFYYNIDEVFKNTKPSAILLSSVLPYLERPHEQIRSILNYPWEYIVVDKTFFLVNGASDRLTVQNVPPSIFPIKIPAWFFNKERFLSHFLDDFQLVSDWVCNDRPTLLESKAVFKGFLFVRR
jgi:putative methyltransferase (TIGR04325 family)